MTTIGAIFLPSNPPETMPAVARAADAAGLEELWLWEDCFLNGGLTAMTAALAVTENLRVGVGIMPVPFRNVASLAMELATLGRLYGDRALPGIGHGVQEWMGQVGNRAASPLTLLREYATALRSLLAGESVTVDGRYVKLDGVKLDWPPATPPVISVAAGGPKTIALAGEVGDAIVLSGGSTPAMVSAAAKTVDGAAEVVVFLPALTGPGAADKLAADALVYKTDYPGAAGSPADIAAVVGEFAAAGASKVILQPVPGEDPADYVRWVAEEVRPLVPGPVG
ncbi:LLM class flavin-dependent oxidoreductase [Actinoplanes bogorensis]|uniref:LLM class flavin-dependent oxidoreductase n=1 Tax=Paractinoplanes bogorensis TaxID=1610840 RepID=A0ABS5Z1K3_9ACTN|nr:LLM class flavin-dependent oxidoreductase [Actinoplanes bogorensis]MBU2669568.1 LLM class flavin-dependent oxidoreductase [Actinoplanes bogorensis]